MLIFKLKIHVTDVVEASSPIETARLVLFDGTCEGSGFRGEIQPGGVDTQRQLPDGTGTLSARYIISGTDADGQPARIFIENNGRLGEEGTTPVVRTDCPSLQWLHTAALNGRIVTENGQLTILIETIDP